MFKRCSNSYNLDNYVWLGGYDKNDDDIWYWIDGTRIGDGHTNWWSGHTGGGVYNYLVLRLRSSSNHAKGEWAGGTDGKRYYLCELVVN